MFENKNYIVAIGLSLIVLLGWQFLIVQPRVEQQRHEQQQAGQTSPSNAVSTDGSSTRPTPQADGSASLPPRPDGTQETNMPVSREAAIAASPRVAIQSSDLLGSINLLGARIDDLHLTEYHETVDESSPTITLLSPSGSEHPYYAEFDWVADPGADVALPDATTLWTQQGSGALTPDHPVVLTWDNGQGLTFRRTISMDDKYMFAVQQTVENRTDQPVKLFPYGLVSRHGTPETAGYYILHEGMVGVFGEEGLKEIKYKSLKDDKQVQGEKTATGWLGITDKYFATALIPDSGTRTFQPRFSYIEKVDGYQADYLGDALTIPAGGKADASSRLFAGAKVVNIVNGYNENLKLDNFDLLIDWGWFYFITKPMFHMIDWFYHLVGNFGIAILLSTVVVKLIFFPLANKSYTSMSRMKKVQPQMMEIRERHKDDKAKQQQAMMELYKKEKINPLAGCLPVVVQIPVFFSLYKVLYITIEMRHAPFFGWIHDLSAPDPTNIFTLFGLIDWAPPHLLMLGIWPLIMGFTMFVQMKMNPAPTDPTQQMIFTWMPVMFTFMLGRFPAGLVIYWAWNNSLSILQQYVIMRRQGVKVELFDNLRSTFKRKGAAEKT